MKARCEDPLRYNWFNHIYTYESSHSKLGSILSHENIFSVHRGLSPADAEYHYLDNARKIPLYGMDLHDALVSEVHREKVFFRSYLVCPSFFHPVDLFYLSFNLSASISSIFFPIFWEIGSFVRTFSLILNCKSFGFHSNCSPLLFFS